MYHSGTVTPPDTGRVSERIILPEGAVSYRLCLLNLANLPSSYEFSDYQARFEYEDGEQSGKFRLRHIGDDELDIVVHMVLDTDNNAVEWDGNMPRSIEANLEKNFHLVKDFPLQMLNMALNNILEDERGMRPPEEIA